MKSFIVTGTDTDAGKTYVSSLIIKTLRERLIDVVPYKPVACGDREDPRKLREASGLNDMSLEEINPLYYKTPAAPLVAARFESKAVDLDALEAGYKSLEQQHECVLIEGVGGWEVPLTEKEMFGDFAARLGLPVVLVVANKLGVLNHTLLTINAIKARGLECAGMIFNSTVDEWDSASITNRGIIEELTDVPVLAELIYGQDYIDLDLLVDKLS